MTDVVLFEGDGIGPEISAAVLEILDAAKAQITWHPYSIGEGAYQKSGELIPSESLEAIKKYKVALKGPVTTPLGKGFRSVNVQLRLAFDLYANVRPAFSYEGLSKFENVDILTVRENTEDLYIGEEHEIDGGFEAIKRITQKGSQRIIEYAFEYAKKHGRKKVTCVHKSNILKNSDGLFVKIFDEVAKQYPQITADKKIVDNMCMQLVMYPQSYDVIVAPNLYGDILSDLIAGLVGGLGLVPGANIGKDVAIFEAVHGSAPDIAGRGVANPIAMLMSACMMLDYIDQGEISARIKNAIKQVLQNRIDLTPDLGGDGNTKSITKAIISQL
ncbi:MAG: isocitrate/isopropylmalate dehydrogenase family protein [Campylobacter sp.]|nr:isocitrate/isopropylmalate dehydrogenase family protein [Campylobacter sp.]